MIFSNIIFLFGALPLIILIYYICSGHRFLQNVWLFIISMFLYAWGEPYYVLLLTLSIIINYILGLMVSEYKTTFWIKPILVLSVAYNIGMLFVFKYMNFVTHNLNIVGLKVPQTNLLLPIGISFYTFQALSYVIDVYNGRGEVQKNPLDVGLYIAFFPQLIAGPIVRYETIAEQIKHRIETIEGFYSGVTRFIYGFAKKIIFANSFAIIADYVFDKSSDTSILVAWLGIISYTLQIYFDFSGYSDMAIGLGRMFGFDFLENFDYPYISKNISEFWRRWHISLGSWFRDYVYIPLGGSRKGLRRLIINLFVVWSLTGIWHGANWTFIAWGIWYFVLLTLEKIWLHPEKRKSKVFITFYYIFTIMAVMVGWIFFRANSMVEAYEYLKSIFGLSGNEVIDKTGIFILNDMKILLPMGIICSTPILHSLSSKLESYTIGKVINLFVLLTIFVLSICFAVNTSYNPFIYFNF